VVNNFVKYAFAVVGIITGITLSRLLLQENFVNVSGNLSTFILIFIAVVCGVLFYSVGMKTAEFTVNAFDVVIARVHKMTFNELGVSAIGLVVGLIAANLICISINRIPVIGVSLSIIINILFGAFGVFLFSTKKGEDLRGFFRSGNSEENYSKKPKILDTSVIIDGRVVDVCRTGIVEGNIIIPDFVLDELRHLADSEDDIVRLKGRRGLDILSVLQNEIKYPVKVVTSEGINSSAEVDEKLLLLAKKMNAKVVTNDYNLNKVAKIKEIPILNINDLANAMKPIAVSGEEMNVKVVKCGKENGQGVGYLEDGTMIVIEGGSKYKGENLDVVVTSVLQTSAGRMIFAKPKVVS